jgi:haloacetate dehalogenase
MPDVTHRRQADLTGALRPQKLAQNRADVMGNYGHERFLVAAHDGGERVAHRLCLDRPESVERVYLMDMAPTLTMYRGTNQEFATKYMWWFFLIQAYPLTEHMIGLGPKFYLQHIFETLNKTPGAIGPDEMNEYTRAFSNDAAIHATCEDFRAAADIDLEMDQTDEKVGRKIQMSSSCPVGRKGNRRRLVGRNRHPEGEGCQRWRKEISTVVTFCKQRTLEVS